MAVEQLLNPKEREYLAAYQNKIIDKSFTAALYQKIGKREQ